VSGLLIQDSGRSGKSLWTEDLVRRGVVAGIVLNPFDTPRVAAPRRPSADQILTRLGLVGGEVMFDPSTHAAVLPTSTNWDQYDGWDLWSGPRGDLSTTDRLNGHVVRVLDAQVGLGVQPIAPALSLDSSVGRGAEQALEMAGAARSQGDEVSLAIVGSDAFWSQGTLLDDYVGQIAQLRPGRVLLSVLRADLAYPPLAAAAAVAGLCRSIHSLSRRSEVIVLYSDWFGLPAVAAGASSIGTGWDVRQRVLAPDAFRLDTRTRIAAKRITHAGLFGVLKRPEAERLLRNDRVASIRLVPGAIPADGNPLWEHHLEVLAAAVRRVAGQADRRSASTWLRDQYVAALAEFARVDILARPLAAGSASWLGAVTAGLLAYMAGEGW
jgi:hypothetical protein